MGRSGVDGGWWWMIRGFRPGPGSWISAARPFLFPEILARLNRMMKQHRISPQSRSTLELHAPVDKGASTWVDWSPEPIAGARRWAETRKTIEAELERLRRQEIRALDTPTPRPRSGRVEQQRLFSRCAKIQKVECRGGGPTLWRRTGMAVRLLPRGPRAAMGRAASNTGCRLDDLRGIGGRRSAH